MTFLPTLPHPEVAPRHQPSWRSLTCRWTIEMSCWACLTWDDGASEVFVGQSLFLYSFPSRYSTFSLFSLSKGSLHYWITDPISPLSLEHRCRALAAQPTLWVLFSRAALPIVTRTAQAGSHTLDLSLISRRRSSHGSHCASPSNPWGSIWIRPVWRQRLGSPRSPSRQYLRFVLWARRDRTWGVKWLLQLAWGSDLKSRCCRSWSPRAAEVAWICRIRRTWRGHRGPDWRSRAQSWGYERIPAQRHGDATLSCQRAILSNWTF